MGTKLVISKTSQVHTDSRHCSFEELSFQKGDNCTRLRTECRTSGWCNPPEPRSPPRTRGCFHRSSTPGPASTGSTSPTGDGGPERNRPVGAGGPSAPAPSTRTHSRCHRRVSQTGQGPQRARPLGQPPVYTGSPADGDTDARWGVSLGLAGSVFLAQLPEDRAGRCARC